MLSVQQSSTKISIIVYTFHASALYLLKKFLNAQLKANLLLIYQETWEYFHQFSN